MAHSRRQSLSMIGLLASLTVLSLLLVTAADARSIDVKIGNAREQAVQFHAQQNSLSKEAAERWVRDRERDQGVRIVDKMGLPEGTFLDFYKVRNSNRPGQSAEFQGRGMLVDAYSYLGRNYKELLFGLLKTEERDQALRLLRQARDHGFMVIPAQAGLLPAEAGATTNMTAAVIATEFPYWDDIAPSSDGDEVGTDLGDANENHYLCVPDAQAGGMRYFPMASNTTANEEQGKMNALAAAIGQDLVFHSDWYADSPGGPFSTSGATWGVPIGLRSPQWNHSGATGSHPYFGGDTAGAQYGSTEIDLRNYWYRLAFDKSNTQGSLYNYLYQNTHGKLALQGDHSDIIGWVRSHHVTDRLRYPGPTYFQSGDGCTVPGTPLIRPIASGTPRIYRASLSSTGLTVLFSHDVPPADTSLNISPPSNFTLQVYQADTSAFTGTQAGTVTLVTAGYGRWVMDPYDSRRWTYLNSGWVYQDTLFGVEASVTTQYRAYALADGQSWSTQMNHYHWVANPSILGWRNQVTSTWNSGSSGYAGQGRGCGALSNTTYTQDDVFHDNPPVDPPTRDTGLSGLASDPGRMGSDVGNRLKSFCYYVHNHGFVPGTDPYQLSGLNNAAGHRDDISGTTGDAYRVDRPFPYDHDVEDHGRPNSGNVLFTPPGQGNHSVGAMRGDIDRALRDAQIDPSGYNRLIYLFPAAGTGENDPMAIIPHASGSILWVPSTCGLHLLAHEFGHTLGMVDLYDNNFYDNYSMTPPVPPYFECKAVTPYSVMAHGGQRIDPWHKLRGNWATPTNVTSDMGTMQLWQVETTLADPMVLKLPAHPLAIYAYKWAQANGVANPAWFPGSDTAWNRLMDPDQWQEYFLIENRNVVGSSYFSDLSPRGMYIWHIDERNIGGFQRAEETLTVAVEQADGLNELEVLRDSAPAMTAAQLAGDPFPGSTGNRNFTYKSTTLSNGAASPVSWSHGLPDTAGMTVKPQTPTDSFVRVLDIGDPGNPMSARVYVEPAEVVVTSTSRVPAPSGTDPFYRVKQGVEDFPVLSLHLNNDGVYPNLSTKACVVNTVVIYEVGTSLRDANLAQAKLYEDKNNNGVVDAGDDLLKTAIPGEPQTDHIVFSNLGYTIPLNQQRNVLVCFDIAVDAITQPPTTVGAELTTQDFVNLDPPGVAQLRQRQAGDATSAGYSFGGPRFPINSTTALIVEDPDTVSVSTTDLAPTTVRQGERDVPILAATFTVDRDSAVLGGIQVALTGSSTAEGGQDILTAKAYLDEDGDDVLDTDGSGNIDASKLLGEALFQAGVAKITGTSSTPMELVVPDGPGVHVIFTVDVHADGREGRLVGYELANGCLTLNYPLGAAADERDVADYAGFPHSSGDSRIAGANSAPYAPPVAAPYDVAWLPAHGAKVAAAETPPTTVNCAFPRARGTTATPPTNAPDPDAEDTGSTLRYEAQFCQAVSFAGGVQTVTISPQGPSPDGPAIFTFTSPGLANGTWFWRVRAIDDKGLAGAYSATRSFTISNRPTPPTNSPTPFYPAGGIYVPNLLPTYQWTRGTDTETAGNQLRTIIEVDDNSDFSSPYFTATSAAGAQSLSNPAGTPLVSGVHYYWRAKTLDGDGMESDWCATQDFTPFENEAPFPPADNFSPANDIEVASVNPTLTWGMGDDPNPQDLGTPRDVNLRYIVELRANNGNWTDGAPPLFTVETGPGVRTAAVGVTLVDNGHYFWRVQTKDPAGLLSPWSTTQSFYVNTVNNAPAAPADGFSPSNGATISSQMPTLQCSQAVDPDPSDKPQWSGWPGTAMTYEFQLRPTDGAWTGDTDYAFRYVVLGDQDRNIVWTAVANTLSNGNWFWRVRATDDGGLVSPWSATQNFVIDTSNQAPVLSTPTVAPFTAGLSPKYGGIADNYEFRVVYTDAEGDAPTEGLWLEIDGNASQRYAMAYVSGAPATGATYNIVLPGNHAALGLGNHTFRFRYLATASQWPASGSGSGPIIGTPSDTVITDSSWTPLPDYPAVGSTIEEGRRVYIEVTDLDENESPTTLDTIRVVVTTLRSPADRERVTLTESDTDSGVFRGSVATSGADYAQANNNGVLEVAGGPTHNVVTVTYADADCLADCPPANVDTSTDTVRVYDTVPPDPVTEIFPLTPPQNEGRSLALDWTSYDEAAQVDVDKYLIYVETSAFSDVRPLTAAHEVPARTVQTFEIPDLTPGTRYYIAVVPQDEVPNRYFMVTGRSRTTADSLPPTLEEQVPAEDATEVARTTNISFRVKDGGSGVRRDSITATYSIDGGAPVQMDGTITPNVNGPNLLFTFDPAEDFPWNSTVTVHVTAQDVAGNALDETYSFTVTADAEGPTVDEQTPAPDSISARNGFVSFHVKDALSGVDVASLAVRKDGTDITADCAVDATDPLDVVVRYPATDTVDFGAVSKVQMTVGAADNAGNRTLPDPIAWEFDVDAVRPVIGNLVPGRDATNVPVDTAISFRLTDSKSGIDPATLAVAIQIGTGAMTPIDAADLTVTTTGGTLDVSYQPETPFDHDTPVTMQVVVADMVGNLIANFDGTPGMYTWSFTTGPTPAFRIAGEVKTAGDAPIPGVAVRVFNAGGAQVAVAVSDGNGTFVAYNMVAGDYRLVPELTEYDFEPTEIEVGVTNADAIGQNFTGTLRTYDVSGRVTEGGVGKAGVTVADSTGTYSAVTDADGNYTLTGVPSGRHTLTPTLEYFKFLPSSTTVVVAGAPVTGQDFQAIADTFSISGSVADFNGTRVQGVRVTDGEHTAITNEAGQYTISGVRAGTVTLSASKAGYKFSPATQTVTVPPAATGMDFTAYLSFAYTFPTGVNLLAVPCFPAAADPVALFGTNLVARWDPTAVPPTYVTPTSDSGLDLLNVVPGRGFFVKLVQGDLEVGGRPVSTTQPFSITLGPVWNMVGNPFTKSVPFGNLIPGSPGTVRSYGWVYDAGSGSYLLVAAEAGVNVARTVIYPWEGMWLRTSGGSATVSVTPPVETAEAPARPQALDLGADGWTIPVVAVAGDRCDRSTTVGVAPSVSNGVQLDNPPIAPDTVDVYVKADDGRYLAQDIRGGAEAASRSWTIVVTTSLADAKVEVSLPDLSQVPNDMAVYLTDTETGRRMYARTMTSYAFQSEGAGGSRELVLEVAPKAEGGLVLTNAVASAGGRGAVVSYGVSRACSANVTVTNIAGRVVRELAVNKASAQGTNTVSWDLRSDAGTPVPNGRYLVRIEALAEDGQRVQAVTSLGVRR